MNRRTTIALGALVAAAFVNPGFAAPPPEPPVAVPPASPPASAPAPARTPPVRVAPQPTLVEFAGTLPSAQEIFSKHLAATGGEAEWKSKTTMHATGAIKLGLGLEGPLDIKGMEPASFVVSFEIPSVGVTETGYDGATAWSIDQFRGAILIPSDEVKSMRQVADFKRDVLLAQNPGRAETTGKAAFNGKTVWQVSLPEGSQRPTLNFYDVETGLLVGTQFWARMLKSEIRVTAVASDYKVFGGVKLPAKLTLWTAAQSFEMLTDTVEWNTLKPDAFALPPVIAALKREADAVPRLPEAVPVESAGTLPAAAELFRKHVEATGGAAAWAAKKSLRTQAKVRLSIAPGIEGRMESISVAPGLCVATLDVPRSGVTRTGFDGTTGWILKPKGAPRILEGRELAEQRRRAGLCAEVALAQSAPASATMGAATFGPTKVWQVRVVEQDGSTYTNLYSQETGLLCATISELEGPKGTAALTTAFDDYKDFNGIKLPTHITMAGAGIMQEFLVERCEWDTATAAECAAPPEIAQMVQERKSPRNGAGE